MDASQETDNMINEINSIRRRYIQNYLRLIQGLEVNTEIVGITPEAELRKLDVVGATNEIVLLSLFADLCRLI